jgi:hypothetical protein
VHWFAGVLQSLCSLSSVARMTLGEQRRKALELLAPPPSRHDHSGVVTPLSYSRPHQAGTTTPMAASRASRGSASSKPSIIGVLAERHARHLAERGQTLQDACKPMHTDPSTIWVICYQRTTQEPFPSRQPFWFTGSAA